MFSSDQTKVTV